MILQIFSKDNVFNEKPRSDQKIRIGFEFEWIAEKPLFEETYFYLPVFTNRKLVWVSITSYRSQVRIEKLPNQPKTLLDTLPENVLQGFRGCYTTLDVLKAICKKSILNRLERAGVNDLSDKKIYEAFVPHLVHYGKSFPKGPFWVFPRSLRSLRSLSNKVIKVQKTEIDPDLYQKIKSSVPRNWKMKYEYSLGSRGVEWTTPPISGVEEASKLLLKAFRAIDDLGGKTKKNCGLHINVSLSDWEKPWSYRPSIFFQEFDENILWAEYPKRKSCMYCQPMKDLIKEVPTSKDLDKILTSINSGCLAFHSNRIEIRSPGGENYHRHPEKVYRILSSLEKYLKSCTIIVA